jgi:MinD-like ATPase involved in chromosome partitioning or flagellar assembly
MIFLDWNALTNVEISKRGLLNMFTVAMYSYKGGAGRTVSTANIASILATMGKKVVCVDFDLDGPGLKIVFGVNPVGSDRYVQDFMNAATARSFPLEESLIDVYPCFPNSNLKEGKLLVFPASQDFKKRLPDSYDYRQMADRIRSLIAWLKEHESPDFVFLDCASGWKILTKACTQEADYIVTFLRLARQHILGTVTIAQLFEFLGFNFCLLPSAVPLDLINQKEHLNAYLQALEDAFHGRVIEFLPEFGRLKWDEGPLCLDELELKGFQESESRDAYNHIIACYEKTALYIAKVAEIASDKISIQKTGLQ